MGLFKLEKLFPLPLKSTLFGLILYPGQILMVNFSQFVILQFQVPLLHLQRFDFKIQSIDFFTQRLGFSQVSMDIDILLFCGFQPAYMFFEFTFELSLQIAALLMMQLSQPFDLVLQTWVLDI